MTKSLLTVAMLLVALAELCAQAPEAFKYQAVARDAAGEPLVNTLVQLNLLIYSSPPPAIADYVEGHTVVTNDNGLFELTVGQGSPWFGAFSSIDWTSGSNFLEVELFETSSNTFVKLGIQQLISVPYAMHSGTGNLWETNGADIYNTNNGKVGIGTTTPGTMANTSARLEIADEDGANSGLLMRTAGTDHPTITIAKQNGTLAAPLQINDFGWIGAVDGMYYNGTNYGTSSRILMQGDGATSGSGFPGLIAFQTTPPGTSIPQYRLTVRRTGNVGIGSPNPNAMLDVSGDALINGLTVGRGAGNDSTNTALGYQALDSNSTGLNNTASGFQALALNTTGTENTASGSGALYSNIEGDGNTALGMDALRSNTIGNSNTAAGAGALYSNSHGSINTASGKNALYSNTTGEGNTAAGAAALEANSTGIDNTANGTSALKNNTIGTKNTANGDSALYSNTEGSFNTAGGKNALGMNTVGNDNTAMGASALGSNTSGSSNVALGFEALYSSDSSNSNTAMGARALRLANGSDGNTALGFDAGAQTTTGIRNVIVGQEALYGNTTGSENVAIGFSALDANTTGSGNTAIGYRANVGSGDLTNATAIGYNAIVGESNALVLGGTGEDAVNVGIGTTVPAESAKLELKSTTKGFLPPRLYAYQRDAMPNLEAGLVIWCYDCGVQGGELQAYNGSQWTNISGGPAADKYVPVIGTPYLGGIVAYVLQPLDPGYDPAVYHGIIASAADILKGYSNNFAWGCDGIQITGASGSGLGQGAQNTIDILTDCSQTEIPATFCDQLVLDGYGDWYLPSQDELDKLYINRAAIGGFAVDTYWSSSQFDSMDAWAQSFSNGAKAASSKTNSFRVRPVRFF